MISLFVELSFIIIVAALVTGLLRALKQPAIIGYVLTGVLVGPSVLNLVSSTTTMRELGSVGVALLLFMVGLQLNPRTLRTVGKVSLLTGIGQVVFTSLGGFGISRLLGFSNLESFYICIALTFSSTIIIMKLLTDKGDVETLYGRIAIGFLIVQDVIAMLILMAVSASLRDGGAWQVILATVVEGVVLVAALVAIAKYFFPPLLSKIARSPEYLLLFSVGWCMVVASLFHIRNFSIELGALLAGITLSWSPYRQEVSSRMTALRDFFLILFFVVLGSELAFQQVPWIPVIAMSAFVLVGNPLIVVAIMGFLGYRKRTSFLAGLTVAQISEFSLILVMLGLSLGHLSQEIVGLVTMVGIITIVISSYFIIYSDRLFHYSRHWLRFFERKTLKESYGEVSPRFDILLFGYNRTGRDLLASFRRNKRKFLVIDSNPDVIDRLREKKIPCVYGDASDGEFLDSLKWGAVKSVVSTIPDFDTNTLILHRAKKSVVVCVASHVEDALALYETGASYVILPHLLSGRHAALMLEQHGFRKRSYLRHKRSHLAQLKQRLKE